MQILNTMPCQDTGIDSVKQTVLSGDKIMGKEEQLWTAVRQENVQKLCEFFEQNNVVDGDFLDVNNEDSCERTPLMWAAHGGNVEVVQLLLENGAASISSSEKKKSKYGWTALHGACMHGHCDVARVLLEHTGGGDTAERLINAKTRPAREVPLHVACQHGHISIVDLLLLEYNANILDKTRAGWSCLHYASHYGQIEIAHRLLQQNADLLFCKDLLGKTPLDVSKNTETSVAILLAYHEYTRQPNTLLVSDLNKALSSEQDISMIVVSNAERILQEQQQEQQEEAKELLNLVKQEKQNTQDTIHEFIQQTRQEQSYDMQAVPDKMQHQHQQPQNSHSQSNLELTRMLQDIAQKLETMQESVAQQLVQRNDQHQMELNLLQERMARYEQQQQDQKQEQSHRDKDDQEQQLALTSDTNPTSTRVIQYEQEPLRLFISLLLSLLLHVPLLLVSRAAHSLESLAQRAAATPPSEEHNKQDYDALKLERDQLETRLMRQQQIANLAASSAAECYAQQENGVVTLRQLVAQLQAQNDYLKQKQQQQLNRPHQHEQQDKCDSRDMEDVILLDHISTNTSMMSLTTGSTTTTSEDEADDMSMTTSETKTKDLPPYCDYAQHSLNTLRMDLCVQVKKVAQTRLII